MEGISDGGGEGRLRLVSSRAGTVTTGACMGTCIVIRIGACTAMRVGACVGICVGGAGG